MTQEELAQVLESKAKEIMSIIHDSAPEPTANKKLIGQLIKDGETIPHAVMQESNNIQIK